MSLANLLHDGVCPVCGLPCWTITRMDADGQPFERVTAHLRQIRKARKDERRAPQELCPGRGQKAKQP